MQELTAERDNLASDVADLRESNNVLRDQLATARAVGSHAGRKGW